jgi:hypothetical protein
VRARDAAPGGGSYCGQGGAGDFTAAGVPYGTPQLSPLLAGSAGGNAGTPAAAGGKGGSAVQLIAGTSFEIGAAGGINVPGNGGVPLTGAGVNGDAGGSGGAILVEATSIHVAGYVTANGGGAAGRIRLNSTSGMATLDGSAIVSPSVSTKCVSQGTVAP